MQLSFLNLSHFHFKPWSYSTRKMCVYRNGLVRLFSSFFPPQCFRICERFQMTGIVKPPYFNLRLKLLIQVKVTLLSNTKNIWKPDPQTSKEIQSMPPFIASQTSALCVEFFLFNLKLLLLKLYGSLRESLKYLKFQRDVLIEPLVTEAGGGIQTKKNIEKNKQKKKITLRLGNYILIISNAGEKCYLIMCVSVICLLWLQVP